MNTHGVLTKSCSGATFAAGLVLALTAFSAVSPLRLRAADSAFSVPARLAAALTDSQRSSLKNINLTWTNPSAEAAGNFVEVDFNGHNDFMILAILASDITTFCHPDLVPDTQFNYRLRPFYGQESNVAAVTTGDAPPKDTVVTELDGPLQTQEQESNPAGTAKKSIRIPSTVAQAAPANLTASLVGSTRVVLKWTDRASDEDGYLVEGAPTALGPFQAMALLPANATSFRQSGLPAHTQCCFRVRAFVYGKYSNLVGIKTPAQSSPVKIIDSP